MCADAVYLECLGDDKGEVVRAAVTVSLSYGNGGGTKSNAVSGISIGNGGLGIS